MERKIITIGGITYKLLYDKFDDEMDIDALLKIDYSNLLGEIITFPVIVNRFGNLLAEMESQIAEKKLTLEIYEAKTKERLRILLTTQANGKAPSVDALNTAVTLDKGYQAMRRSFNETIKNKEYIQSTFWSAKDKSGKLDKLSLTIQNGDINESLIESKVNNVIVKRTKKLIE